MMKLIKRWLVSLLLFDGSVVLILPYMHWSLIKWRFIQCKIRAT